MATYTKRMAEVREQDYLEGLISMAEYLDEADDAYEDACDDADEWYDAQIDRGE